MLERTKEGMMKRLSPSSCSIWALVPEARGQVVDRHADEKDQHKPAEGLNPPAFHGTSSMTPMTRACGSVKIWLKQMEQWTPAGRQTRRKSRAGRTRALSRGRRYPHRGQVNEPNFPSHRGHWAWSHPIAEKNASRARPLSVKA